MSLVLPDGLGDQVFGECAALELALAPSAVTWVRAYATEEALLGGEALGGMAPDVTSVTHSYGSPEALAADLETGVFDELWASAHMVLLAPWIFGIYAHDEALLALARRTQREFWAAAEYGRGMGPLRSYSSALGSRVPTGWAPEATSTAGPTASAWGGVFKTILRAPETGTDWRARLVERLGLLHRPRLWWAYSRRDSAHRHAFRLLSSGSEGQWPRAAKLIPLAADGGLATGRVKTTGELLAEEASSLLRDPGHQVSLDMRSTSEVASHVVGQLSELLIHVLTRELPEEDQQISEVIVAPNSGISEWAGGSVVEVVSLELVDPAGAVQVVTPGRSVFLVAEPVPRAEMRSFLEQCEAAVVATGDQSTAEAVLLEKVPLTRPDAKVAQWEIAVETLATGRLQSVPDLGQVLRSLLWSESTRAQLTQWSDTRSAEVEAKARAEFGGEARSPEQEAMLRAGMLG